MAMKYPDHPGWMVCGAIEDLNVSVAGTAAALNVSRPALSNLLNERAGISPEMAVRLSTVIGSTPGYWMRLQMNYDLAQVEQPADSIVVKPLPVAHVA